MDDPAVRLPPDTRLLAAAVADNVRWIDLVARSHGLGTTTGRVWSASHRTPDGYPEAVTTTAGATAEEVLAALPVGPGPVSVKDSFADVDLSPAGFGVLFEARWLVHAGRVGASGHDWSVMNDDAGLRRWRAAWGDVDGNGPVRSELLGRDDVTLLLRGAGTACAIATPAGDAVGVGNVVWADGAPDWPNLVAAVRRSAPGRPVVGYEHGEALEQALEAGAEVLGPLRVWLRS